MNMHSCHMKFIQTRARKHPWLYVTFLFVLLIIYFMDECITQPLYRFAIVHGYVVFVYYVYRYNNNHLGHLVVTDSRLRNADIIHFRENNCVKTPCLIDHEFVTKTFYCWNKRHRKYFLLNNVFYLLPDSQFIQNI
jgi:hypothetical protein